LDDCLIFVKFLSYKGRSDDIFLVVCKIDKKSDALQTFSVITVVPNDNFFNRLSKSLSVNYP